MLLKVISFAKTGIAEVFESMGPADASDILTDDETFRSVFPPPAATRT